MLRNDNHLYDRIGKKQRRNIMMSRELIRVLDATAGSGQASSYVERAVWNQLVRDYGREEVREAIEEAQDEIDAENRLSESKPYSLEA